MTRRNFLKTSSLLIAASALAPYGFAKKPEQIDAAWYRRSRRFVELPVSRVAYVEHGSGPAALFIHGYRLNGFQWRGALERLHMHRRCIAPDVMGMGFTETPEGQTINATTQAAMLAMFLDALHIDTVDLVANDSGGAVAQLFLAQYPQRVRTLLLTNCDVDENSPPPQLLPFVEKAKKGAFIDEVILPQLKDKQLARSASGLGDWHIPIRRSYPTRRLKPTSGRWPKLRFRGRKRPNTSSRWKPIYWCRSGKNYADGRDLHEWYGE